MVKIKQLSVFLENRPGRIAGMMKALADAGLPGAVSYSAGAFVCNDVMYTVLHRYAGTGVRAGFIHVPFLPQQAAEGVPSMALEEIVRGLEVCVGVL